MLRESGDIPEQTEVLVLGAGIAGHCAALAAADAGAQVLFLEKSGQPGGSSAIAGGGFALACTDLQKEAGIDDSIDAYRQDLNESNKGKANPALVEAFLANQLDAYDFLRAHGVKFEFPTPPPTAYPPRVHWTGTGRAVTSLHMTVRQHPNIQFFSKSAAMRLSRDPETRRVNGAHVFFGDREVFVAVSKGVILCTGGFSRSNELLQTFAPELVAGIKHGGVANTGDGLMMATDLGAGQADLGYVAGSFGGGIRNYPQKADMANEIPPLMFSFLSGGIMVNKEGHRFTNEGLNYKKLSSIGMAQTEGIGFQVFDSTLFDESRGDSSVNNYEENLNGGYLRRAETIRELAQSMDIDPDALEATIARYNADVANGTDTEYGRTFNLKPVDTAPYYIAATGNAITSTYGGITADGEMQVVDWFGEPIEGLYAAGEVVGGFHGAGYYSASSLASSSTFGMLAGRNAAARAAA